MRYQRVRDSKSSQSQCSFSFSVNAFVIYQTAKQDFFSEQLLRHVLQ